jgi:adenine phosphoribosyltransferase
MTPQLGKAESSQLQLPLGAEQEKWLKGLIRDVNDFPKPGIVFKDLTTLLKDGAALNYVMSVLAEHCRTLKPDVIAGIEARGFIFAPTVAYMLDIGFVPIRKPNKLPYKVEKVTYDLEYGTDTIELHIDAIEKGQRVILIDDLLATGGTACGAHKLLKAVGGNVVGTGFIVELGFLDGREKLESDTEVFSILKY